MVGPTLIELKSQLTSPSHWHAMAAASSSNSGMGSGAEAGKIPADPIPDRIPTSAFPCCSPGRRQGAADASAMEALMTREALASVAFAAQKVRRIPDVLVPIYMIAEIYSPLTPEEEKLIFAGVKMVFSDKYNALRRISRMKEEEQQNGKPAASEGLEMYRLEVLEVDMERTCNNVLHMVQDHLLPFCSGEENVVLYTKMVGDINWILAMLSKVEDKELHVERTLAAYKAASMAAKSLSPAHNLRLAVNLTETAFYFDVMGWPELATELAKEALDKARPELASLDEESYDKSAEIMMLMEDNLKLWTKPTSPQSEDNSESENNITSFSLASLSLDEAGPSNTNGSPSPPPPSPSPPVVPHSAGYSLEEGPYSDGYSESDLDSLSSLDEAGPSYTNGSPSPPPPPPPPVVPHSAGNSLEEGPSYSDGSPSPAPPVIPRSAGTVASIEFTSPGDWGYQVHEGLTSREIRSRKKAAQMKRGCMG